LGVKFLEGEGPVFDNPIKISKDVINLPDFEPDNLSYVYKAVSNIKNALPKNIPLIGFSGSPWTLAAYSIEGRSSKNFEYTKSFIRNNREEVHIFLQKLTDACFIYLKKQVKAGADVIQIFDSWANLLSKKDYETYSLNYIRSLISKLKEDQMTASIPIILFAREPEISCNQMVEVQADCLSLYWKTKDIDLAFLNGKVALQGNLNPEILLQEDSVIKNEADRILKQFKNYDGYIFNLGHGITPNIDPDKIKLLTDHIRSR